MGYGAILYQANRDGWRTNGVKVYCPACAQLLKAKCEQNPRLSTNSFCPILAD